MVPLLAAVSTTTTLCCCVQPTTKIQKDALSKNKKINCSLPESNERSSHDIIVQVRRLTTWPNELILFMTNLKNSFNILLDVDVLHMKPAAQRL
jgi:hypothetical protein